MSADRDTERTAVGTYVPAYQRDIWDEHAEELGMSRSEFVRSMVQAGRRGFDPRGSTEETGPDADTENATDETEPRSSMERTIRQQLEQDVLSWEELFEAVTGDIESQLDAALQQLQADNVIQHSGRKGGYELLE